MYKLNDVQMKIFLDRYSMKDDKGNPIEKTVEAMWGRVSKAIASVEKDKKKWEQEFYNILEDFKFIPGGRISAGAGTGQDNVLSNCFVIPIKEDSRKGIMNAFTDLVILTSRGGGVGLSFSILRPRNAHVKGVNGKSSGPVSWAIACDALSDQVVQGGSRRAAVMMMMDIWHPSIEEFITVKQDFSKITRANLSVCISDIFMEAVNDDLDWNLEFPDTTFHLYDKEWDGNLTLWKEKNYPIILYKTVKARYLWDLIIKSAWTSGEPGIYFMERANKMSNTWYLETMQCTNACGEQALGPYGSCNLSHINLSKFIKNGEIDYSSLAEVIRVGVRFLDNIIECGSYPIQEIKDYQLKYRRIGLGTLGLADMLIMLKIRYGSEECVHLLHELYSFIRDIAYETSVELAKEKGFFPLFDGDKYIKGNFINALPPKIVNSIKKHGIRNSWLLTQAPTGTGSLLSRASSGIEPNFAFETERSDGTGVYVLNHYLVDDFKKKNSNTPLPHYFISASKLTPEEHISVQAVIQQYTDNSQSKTINSPNSHTVEDTKRCYELAYASGCRSVAYYRDGSRDKQVLTEVKPKGRPDVLQGETFKQPTGCGNAYITISKDNEGKPHETFLHLSKGGGCVAAFGEAIGRLTSTALRAGVSSDIIKEQLSYIRCPLPVLGGATSCPDAIARALGGRNSVENKSEVKELKHHSYRSECPECGFKLVFREGCVSCLSCSYTQCS